MSENLKIVAQATIEAFSIRLYTNGDSGAFQMLDIAFGSADIGRRTWSVNPIDFADIINAIMFSEDITEFIEAVEATYIGTRLENMILNIIDEVEA